MKTVGIIGGIGPESTIEYYRFIIDGYRALQTDDSYPALIVNSVDLNKLITWMNAGELGPAADYLVGELDKLARAGADFGALASNTPHIVFDQLRARTSIPLISIVEATRDHALALGLKRPGLFGTRFTMRAQFYPEVFQRVGLPIIVPNSFEQDFIHEKYMNELLKNRFLDETRERLMAIANRMKEADGIDGLILGGTELPLILRDDPRCPVPLLDTTRIHVARIVQEILS